MKTEEEIKEQLDWLLKNDINDRYLPCISTLLWVLGKDLEGYLKETEENTQKLKALEIIKNKKVNLEYLKCCETYEQYKTVCSYWDEISQEEFKTVKEALL